MEFISITTKYKKRNLITSGSAIDLQSRPEIIIKIKAGAALVAEGGIFLFLCT